MEKMSRRDFLHNGALAGAVVAVAGVAGGSLTGCASAETASTGTEAAAGGTTTIPTATVQPSTSGALHASTPNVCDGEVGGLPTFSGGRVRPKKGEGHPLPQFTGYVGEDAKPIIPVEVPAQWTEEADIVIVGAGYGGLTAASWAAQHGSNAILLEKYTEVGGTSAHAAINMCVGGGAKEQIATGYFWPKDTFSLNQIVNKLNNEYQNSVDINLLHATVIANPIWMDWMQEEQNAGWVCVGSCYVRPEIADHSTTTVIGNRPTCDLLADNAEKAGAQILLNTTAETLVVENGRVVGVKATSKDGSEVYYKGKNGVLLTAGHFGMNLDLIEQYCPSAYMQASTGGPMPWTTGECFRMGLGVGADVSGFNSWCCWDGASDDYWGSGDGNYWHYFWSGERQLAKNPWLLLDKAGNRLPYYAADFTAGNLQPGFDIDTYSMGDLTNSAAWMASIGNRNYCIFDADYATNVFNFKSAHTALDEGRTPVHEGDGTPEQDFVSQDWEAEFRKAIDRGAAFEADTIEELAEMVGLDPEKAADQVEKWNEIVASGDDSEFTPQYLPDWLVPVATPPFYCIPNSGQIGKIMTGLRVNEEMNVLRADSTPIEGLYAGYYTAGGICGESSYGGQFGNASLAGGVAISGVGGLMAVRAMFGDPITEDDLCDEAKALNEADKKRQSEAYLAKAADGSYLPKSEADRYGEGIITAEL